MFEKIRLLFNNDREKRNIYTILLIGSSIGLLASFVLSVEAITLAENSQAPLSCSINEAINCAAVGSHESASLLGFPNAFIGMMALPVMVTIAVAGLAGVKFPRWFMIGAFLGGLAGLIFAGWMFYMSLLVIQVLCPWCLTLDVGMILIFYAVSKYAVRENLLGCSKQASKKINNFIDGQYDILLLVAVFLAMITAIILKFGNSLFM